MRALVTLLLLLSAVPALRAQTAPPAAPLWLGNPGVDAEKARAALRQRAAERLRWELATSIGDYERIGQKDPRWDADVHTTLEQYAHILAQEPGATTVGARPAIQHAQANGCKDPMLSYAYLQLGFYPSDTDKAAVAKLYAQMEQDMDRSNYSPFRKFCASFQAGLQAAKAAKPKISESKTLSAPEGTDAAASFSRAGGHLAELLRDSTAQRDSAFAVAFDFLGYAQDDPSSAATFMAPLAALFDAKGKDALNPTATTKLIEGLFWVDYAWQARTRHWANNVTDEGWRLFGERLPRAAAALEAAYVLDPGDEHIAETMLSVELGQGKGRDRMETWFRRGIDVNPDTWTLCVRKLEYIKPKWYGSEKDLLQFGHQCLAAGNWRSYQPLILFEAHKVLADEAEDQTAYWRQPEVWHDIQRVCQGMLAAFPNARFRTTYAVYACLAGQWNLADQMFKEVGDNPDFFGVDVTRAQYDELRRMTAAKVGQPPHQ